MIMITEKTNKQKQPTDNVLKQQYRWTNILKISCISVYQQQSTIFKRTFIKAFKKMAVPRNKS